MNIAIDHGYKVESIFKIINKQHNKFLKDNTTLKKQKPELKIKKFTHDDRINNRFKRIFKKHDITPVYSNNYKIGKLLGNPKDKEDKLDQSGIYKINCNNCEKYYVGMTKRNIKTRFKEHFQHIKNNNDQKSAIANHVLTTGHSISLNNIDLLQPCNNPQDLPALESIHIYKHRENLVNFDLSCLGNPLLPLL